MLELIGDLGRLILGAWIQPRASVRQLLGRAQGARTGLLLSVLGWVIGSLILVLLAPRADTPAPGPAAAPLVMVVVAIATAVLMYLACAWLVWRIGRAFGGRGTLDQAFVVMGWNNLVGSPLTLLQTLIDQPMQVAVTQPGQLLVLMAYAGVAIWLLSVSVAELHGFASVARVVAVVLLLPLATGLLFAILAAMMGGAGHV